MTPLKVIIGVLLGVILLLSSSNGYPQFQQRIPNGDHIPNPCNRSTIWPGVGHQNIYGSGPRNPFGLDFQANNYTWNRTLCMEDSDGDGRTNGEELGDPNCTWTQGPASAITNSDNLTHPGVCEPLDSHNCLMMNSWFNGCGPKTFDCPGLNDPAVTSFVRRIPVTLIPNVETTYICYVFEFPSNSTSDIIAFEPVFDNAQMIHHIGVFGCSEMTDHPVNSTFEGGMDAIKNCLDLIGIWTVGSQGVCLNSQMGLRIGPDGYQYGILQIHWNNPLLIQNLTDSSGMKFYQTMNLRPNRGEILVVGQTYLEIPPNRQEVTFTGNCSFGCTKELPHSIFMTTIFLHMHVSGSSGEVALYRNGSRVYTFVVETHYDYNDPQYITLPNVVEVKPGDQIYVKCVYSSIGRNHTTYMGLATTSTEMCYGFFTYYPQIDGLSLCTQWKTVDMCRQISDPIYLKSPFCDLSSFLTLLAVTGYTCNESCTETTACRVVLYGMYETGCSSVLDVMEYVGVFMPSYLSVYMRCAAVIPPPTTTTPPATTTQLSTATRTTTPSSTAATTATTPTASSQSTMVQCFGDKSNRSPNLSLSAATVVMLWLFCAIIKSL